MEVATTWDSLFHPAVASWFRAQFATPTRAQVEAWPALSRGESVLVSAPTGSGKTLSAFLVALDALYREGTETGLPDETRVLYVSPLRALSNDVEKNLLNPLAGVRDELAQLGYPDVEIRTHVRTGDTRAQDRAKVSKRPPHIYVTTPESFYILLTSEGGRRLLRTVRTVIVDEIHALLPDKRGSHLALSLERLDALAGRRVQRIGLSATQEPLELVADFLVGSAPGTTRPVVVDLGHARERDLAMVVPNSPLDDVMSGEVWEEVYGAVAALIEEHRTTLVFVNTRRLCERLARHLGERLGDDRVTAHHGSLAREHRLRAEQRLKGGQLKAIVATASLELGIDVGDVDLVVQIGGPRSIATFLQRVGRSGHSLGGVPKGRIFPLSRDELVEGAALLEAVKRGELDRIETPEAPLDILAQQIVASVAADGEWLEDELYALVKGAFPYRRLARSDFEAVLEMLAAGFTTDRGRRSAHIFRDVEAGRLRPRRGARLFAITSGGAIPDVADYEVVLDPEGVRVGTVHEDFAIESMAGDIFQLGNTSYAIRRVEAGRVRVVDAAGAPPTIPFWIGEAPSRSKELSVAVSRLRTTLGERILLDGTDGAIADLRSGLGLGQAAAEQIVTYLALAQTALGAIPTQQTLVLERFFDEVGSMHLVLHAPFGGKVLRAYGLALRKCFCRKFDFELQAAANDDSIILSLGPTHSFPLEEVFGYLRSESVRDVLIQALLAAPLFTTRFRWNAQRALAIPRFRGGKRVPPRFQRMDADDLLTTCFPDQVACAENLVGDREIPDHPLVSQTVVDATTEALDLPGLVSLLQRMERQELRLFALDVTEPSPLAGAILTAKPYAFLDDAPLEERRTQAVLNRRWLDLSDARVTSHLNPEAIARVVREAWPDPRNPDELLDALETYGWLVASEGCGQGLQAHFEVLLRAGRARELVRGVPLWVAKSRWPAFAALDALSGRQVPGNPSSGVFAGDPAESLRELLRGRLLLVGPVTESSLSRELNVPESDVHVALVALEAEGIIFRGSFGAGAPGERQWCERRLLGRMHRLSLDRLRAEVQPVSQQDFVRFLFRFHGVDGVERRAGPEALRQTLLRLEGFEAAASAWESDLLPLRLDGYDPAWLDSLCLSGEFCWLRRSAGAGKTPVRTTPLAFVPREHLGAWLGELDVDKQAGLSASATRVLARLEQQRACFFGDLLRETKLLPSQLEESLAELVAKGLVSSDSFSGLRGLLAQKAPRGRAQRPRYSLETAGRWTVLERLPIDSGDLDIAPARIERAVRALLSRYGVVFRQVLELESGLPSWRELLACLRRLEARGEVRGGRFVQGYVGEQFALPEVVAELRKVRASKPSERLIAIGPADPLNVVGVLIPGERVAAGQKRRLLFQDGLCVAVGDKKGLVVRGRVGGTSPTPADLVGSRLHPWVRSYLGSSA